MLFKNINLLYRITFRDFDNFLKFQYFKLLSECSDNCFAQNLISTNKFMVNYLKFFLKKQNQLD